MFLKGRRLRCRRNQPTQQFQARIQIRGGLRQSDEGRQVAAIPQSETAVRQLLDLDVAVVVHLPGAEPECTATLQSVARESETRGPLAMAVFQEFILHAIGDRLAQPFLQVFQLMVFDVPFVE